jgi:hypothetical protein
MIGAKSNPGSARGALVWLADQRDGNGTWHSTQATVLALKALLAGTGKPLGGEKQRRIEISLDGEVVREVVIPADQADVVRQIDLSASIARGSHKLELTDRTDTDVGYQVALSYYMPEQETVAGDQRPLSIEVAYDRTELTVDETLGVTATVTNNMSEAAPMVIVDLPIPAGFAMAVEDLRGLVDSATIAKYQVTARSAVIYLRQLPPGKPRVLKYRLRATMPVKVTARGARAYEYYDPDKKVAGRSVQLTVLAAG